MDFTVGGSGDHAGVTVEGPLIAALFGLEGVDTISHSARCVAVIGGSRRRVGAIMRAIGVPARLHRPAESIPRLLDRAPVTAFGVMADLDWLTTRRQRLTSTLVRGVRSDSFDVLAGRLVLQCLRPVGLACVAVAFREQGRARGATDTDPDLEPSLPQRFRGGVDGELLRLAITGGHHDLHAQAAGPTPMPDTFLTPVITS